MAFFLSKGYRTEVVHTLRIAWPLVITQIGQIMMGLIDNAMIGRVSAEALAASAVANNLFFTVLVFAIGSMAVLSPLVSEAMGEKIPSKAAGLFYNGIVVGVALSLPAMAVCAGLALNFHWFRQPEEISAMAAEFLLILSFTIPPVTVFLVSKNFTDGLSFTLPAVGVTMAGLVCNVLLNWMWIYGNLGFEAMGLTGAGYATLVSRCFMAGLALAVVFWLPLSRKVLASATPKKLQLPVMSKLLKLGVPGGMQGVFEVSAYSFAAVIVGWLGTIPLAAHQVVLGMSGFTYMISHGVATAGSVRAGDALGRRSSTDLSRSVRVSLGIITLLMVFFCAVFLMGDTLWLTLFTEDAKVIEAARNILIIMAFYQLSDGLQVVNLALLRAMHDVNIPTIITLVAYWGLAVPAGYVFGIVAGWGVEGVWYALFLGLTLSASLLGYRLYKMLVRKEALLERE